MKTLIICKSIHHKNTEKIANVFAEVLDAQIETPEQTDPEELQEYGLIGFGSGIYSAKHHETILELADRLSKTEDKKAFIFLTSAIVTKAKVDKDHALLREKLRSKGYVVVDEFSCRGFNTNSFLNFFGGMNRGRPNTQDLEHAREFAARLKQYALDV